MAGPSGKMRESSRSKKHDENLLVYFWKSELWFHTSPFVYLDGMFCRNSILFNLMKCSAETQVLQPTGVSHIKRLIIHPRNNLQLRKLLLGSFSGMVLVFSVLSRFPASEWLERSHLSSSPSVETPYFALLYTIVP